MRMITTGSILVGGLIGIFAASGIVLNIFVLVVMVNGGFLSTGSNIMYLMAFNLLISDTIQLAFNLFYQAPASALQREICYLANVDLNRVGGFFCLWMWNNGGCMLTLLSSNRLIQICYPQYTWLFTRKNTVVLCVVIWPLCFLLTATSQYFMPCCEFIIFYPAYSYNYITKANTTNYSLRFVDTPSNCLCSLVAIVSYSMIFYKVRMTRHNLAAGLSEKMHSKRRQKEYRFALQFLAISAFYTITWISFRIYPLFIPPQQPKWFSLLAISSIANASVNAWVYVYFNSDINKASRRLIGGLPSSSSMSRPLYSPGNSSQHRETTQ